MGCSVHALVFICLTLIINSNVRLKLSNIIAIQLGEEELQFAVGQSVI